MSETGGSMRGGATLGGLIDESSLIAEQNKNPNYGPHNPHPFQAYTRLVMQRAGVRDAQVNRECASIVCGIVASLPDVPDREETLDDGKTEYDLQVARTAADAEEQMDTKVVMTVTARKLVRAALELRYEDPDGSKRLAWVNDPMPGELVA